MSKLDKHTRFLEPVVL